MNEPPDWDVAGVDVGASGVRVAVRLARGRVDAELDQPLPRHDGHVDVDLLAAAIATTIARATGGADRGTIRVLAVGMAGFPDLVDSPSRLGTAIGARLGAHRVLIASDALTTHLGALGNLPGTVVAAGTGVIALGTDHVDRWRRVDGWGLLLGDDGGGAWVGRTGLAAALRAVDGRRDGSPLLLESLRARFGSEDDLVRAVYSANSPSYVLGQFAPSVAEAARSGDAIARSIWHEAGRHLASAALAASEPGDRFSWGGGIFGVGDLLLDPFVSAIRAAQPDAILTPPAGSSLDGALRLAAAEGVVDHASFVKVVEVPPVAEDESGNGGI